MVQNSSHLPIKVSIIGLGKIGSQYDLADKSQALTHASAVLNDPRFELIGGVDQDCHSRTIFQNSYGVRAFPSISELMAHSAPDVVTIATTTDNHIKDIIELLEYQAIKLVLCEKPISRKILDLESLNQVLELSEKTVLVNYQRRTEITAHKIRTLIEEEQFGAFLGGSGFYSRGYYNNASHMIDLLEWWLKSKFEIINTIEVSKQSGDYEATMALRVRNQNFLLQTILSSHTSIFEINLQFELAQIRYSAGGAHVYIDDVMEDKNFKGIRTIATSNTPLFANHSANLISVYNDIYSKLIGETSFLTTAADAVDLIRRMQKFIEEKGELSARN
jgi:predicted dehydrogenase